VAAMEHALKRLRTDFPLSNRLIREIHKILLSGDVAAALGTLQKLNIVKEISGRKRNRHFSYQRYLNLLIEGTES